MRMQPRIGLCPYDIRLQLLSGTWSACAKLRTGLHCGTLPEWFVLGKFGSSLEALRWARKTLTASPKFSFSTFMVMALPQRGFLIE